MKNYSEISLRYMKQNKKRTTLTIMGIVLATILIFAIGTFLLSFRDAMIENIKHNDGDYEFRLNHLSSEEAEKVINNAEVKNSAIIRNDDSGYILKGKDDKEVYINYVDKDYFKRMYTYKVIEGNIPTNSEEVIIDTYTEKNLKVGVGDTLSLESKGGENKKFKIVGISEPKYYSGIVIYSYFDNSKLDKNYKYDVAVNLKSDNNKQKIINKVISDANIKVNDNTKLDSTVLYLTGNGGNAYDTSAIQNIIIFVLAVIMVSTIIVIFNSFNISVIERIRYFGIIKAIGATPKQIMRIVFKEGFLMGVIAFPIGCIIGFLSLKFGIKLFIGDQLINLENFKVDFYPIVVLITLGLVAVTIFLSLLGPALKAKRVSAVDAMRNRNEIKIGKLKRRKGRIISKLFGVEGSIAYKNIRRTPFRFIVTVLALTISIIMFNVFYGFIDFAKQSVSQQFLNQAYEASLGENNATETFSKDEIEELKNKNFLKNMFMYKKVDMDLIIENKFVNKEFSAKTKNDLDDGTYKNLDYTKYNRISLISGNVENLKIIDKYIIDGKFNETALKNGGIILIEDCQIRNSAGKLETVNATNYKVGDKIKIPKLKSYAEYGSNKEDKSISVKEWNNRRENEIKTAINNGEFYELPVIAIANKEPFSGSSSARIGIVINEDLSDTLLGSSDPTAIYFNYDNDKDRELAGEYFQSTKTSNKYRYDDSKESMDKFDQIYKQVSFFVYCFIIIITAISVVNIFNTISTNLLLRKKEFSTLKAIGMTEKQLKKSVMLEGTLYGIISAVLGGIGSAILLAVLIRAGGGIAEIKYKFGVIPFLLSIGCAILVTYISTLAPLKRIEKLTIVEGISDEE